MEATYNGHKFSDADVVDGDGYIPEGGCNPHNIRPWLVFGEHGTLAVVFAFGEQEALDYAADAGKLMDHALSAEDEAELGEDVTYLGNASEPYNIERVGMIALPNPSFSFTALFNASQATD